MKLIQKLWPILLALVGIALSVGCSHHPRVSEVKEPEWVLKGSGAFPADGSFHGVGMVSGVKNKALAITAADNRARAEIGKVFEVYTASLMRDYMASTTAGDFSATSEEQHIEQAVKTFSSATLSGVVIVDHWTDPRDGTVYSLAKLDLNHFQASLDKMKELNAEVRDYVRRNAERAFQRLSAEEKKRR